MQAINPRLQIEPVVADIENLPLGLFGCDLLLTALDSRRSRIAANYAFGKLGIPYWIDSGVSTPSLVRISMFAQGTSAPCYECSLDNADYSSEQSYPCQPEWTPPPSNSPDFLGALAAGFQAAEHAKLVSGSIDQALLNRELIYDTSSHRLFVTRLVRRAACRFDHQPFTIRQLRQSPQRITLAEAFALGSGRSKPKSQLDTSLEVPGRLFARELGCPCGARRRALRLQGRFRASEQTCAKCGQRMVPLGSGLANVLARAALAPRELARPLSALGLQPADVIAIGERNRVAYLELGSS
jgi:hypothetical protein